MEIIGFQVRNEFSYLILELGICDMHDFSKKYKLSENSWKSIIYDVISGVGEIHRRGIAHLDLKPNNLLMRKDGRVLITDFGLSQDMSTGRSLNACTGTPGVSFIILILCKSYHYLTVLPHFI